MPGAAVRIRAATPADAPAVMDLMRALADHGGDEAFVLPPPERLAEAMAASPPLAEALIAEAAGEPVGYVSWTTAHSIWSGGPYLNLDDLFVREDWRGGRVGEALMRAFAEVALARGLRARWEVAEINGPAQRFYARLGAELVPKRIARWSLPAMAAVASDGSAA
jgi:GNAT superfamily N-acetyltransferase